MIPQNGLFIKQKSRKALLLTSANAIIEQIGCRKDHIPDK